MKKLFGSLIITVLIFILIFLSRGNISSAFADFSLKTNNDTVSEAELRILAEKYENQVMENEKNNNLKQENDNLKALLSLKRKIEPETVAAEVISFGNNADYRYLFADCGTNDGVCPGNCVISENGLVGMVEECGENWCGIKTLQSESVKISVSCRGNGKTYFLTGGDGKLSFVSSGDDVVPGDLIVTSGLADNIPKGLKVGRIYKVNGSVSAERDVIVSVFEKYSDLKYVLICTGGDVDE